MDRRSLLRSVLMAAPVVALAGCTSAEIAKVTNTVVTDAKLLSNGFEAMLTSLASVGAIPQSIVSAVDSYLAKALSFASSINADMTQNEAAGPVAQIGSAVSSVITGLAAYKLPANVEAVLKAIQTLLPVIEAAVGLLGSTAVATGLTVAQARAVLAQA